MLDRSRHLAAWLLAVAAAGAWFGAAGAAAGTASLQVNVNTVHQATIPFTLVYGNAVDVSPNTMAFARVVGDTPSNRDFPGASAKQIVALAGVDPHKLKGARPMTVTGQSATIALTKDDVLDGIANADGAAPANAVFAYDSSVFGAEGVFLVPLRAGARANEFTYVRDDDAPGPDTVVDLEVQGNVLPVDAQADNETPKVGETVTFTARPKGPGAGAGWMYSWSFGDGVVTAASADTTVRHTFAARALRAVTVTATHGADDAGVSAPIYITIGLADPPPNSDDGQHGADQSGTLTRRPPGQPGSSSSPAAAATGIGAADRTAAATGALRKTKRRGATAQSDATTPAPAGGRAGTGAGRGAMTAAGSGAGATGAASGRGKGSGRSSAAGGSRARAGGDVSGAPAPPRAGKGAHEVRGVLLADHGVAATGVQASELTTANTRRLQLDARAGRGGGGGGIPVWIGSALALAALLWAGFAIEMLPATRREVVPTGHRGWLLRRASYRRVWA